MKQKHDAKKPENTKRIELDLEEKLVTQLDVMEKYTRIPKGELVGTALKRFISSHKDYFPEDYFKAP